MANKISIVEVSLRDGLQNEKTQVTVENKVKLAEQLIRAGVRRIELGAFVRPDRVPQMQGSTEVIQRILTAFGSKIEGSALVPNLKGFEQAGKTLLKEISLFTAASESFTRSNINCTIEESFERFAEVFAQAKKKKIKVRGYLSTCFGCPYEGKVDEGKVIELALRLIHLGCYEVSIGDTIGVGNPTQVRSLFTKLAKKIPKRRLAAHFHDTRGTALANILMAYQLGIQTFDSSLGGLGGCPYAPGASGNVATEDIVFMFEGMGITTGIDLAKLVETSRWFGSALGKSLPSKMSQAGVPKLSPKSFS